MTLPAERRPARLRRRLSAQVPLWGALLLQFGSAIVFLYLLFGAQLGLRTQPVNWAVHEAIELAAAAGLIIGTISSSVALRLARRRMVAIEAQLRAASGAFHDLLEERMSDWALTPAEREVALFAIKGMTTAEIAQLRATSEGTVKAQTAAVYRKAGVSSRPQLLSLFIEELMDDGLRLPDAQRQRALPPG